MICAAVSPFNLLASASIWATVRPLRYWALRFFTKPFAFVVIGGYPLLLVTRFRAAPLPVFCTVVATEALFTCPRIRLEPVAA